MLPQFDSSSSRFDRLLGQAVRLQLGQMSDEEFRKALDEFFRGSNSRAVEDEICFERLRPILNRPDGYKAGVERLVGDDAAGRGRSRFNLWARRFGLLQHMHVRSDALILREGATIPPHGHCRVVSGFYLLEGRVACRHYDRVREESGSLLVRKALDLVHEPGGYSTNSEQHHNIHWLQGIAPVSYLFRVTVTETPTAAFGTADTTNERIYVDPTGPSGEDGLIRASYVSEERAKSLRLVPHQILAGLRS
jgi:hypothetical protein